MPYSSAFPKGIVPMYLGLAQLVVLPSEHTPAQLISLGSTLPAIRRGLAHNAARRGIRLSVGIGVIWRIDLLGHMSVRPMSDSQRVDLRDRRRASLLIGRVFPTYHFSLVLLSGRIGH